MQLTDEQAHQALAKINSKLRNCPCCGSNEGFKFDKHKFDIGPVENIKTVLTNGYYDSIPVMVGYCKHCGFILQFNIQALGIL